MWFDCHARNVACNFHTRALRHVRSLLTDDVAQTVTCSTSLLGWTTAMRCWVAHRRWLSTSYTAPRTTWPESSARAGVAPTPGRCFTRYTGFRWGSGSPINWLYWLTRCGPQPLQRISASWYRPVHHLGLCALPMLVVPRIHTELARRAFPVADPSTWNSLPADIRLCMNILTFKSHLKTHLFKFT